MRRHYKMIIMPNGCIVNRKKWIIWRYIIKDKNPLNIEQFVFI